MIINPVVSGVQLPELVTPANAGQILSGYQAINEDGEILTGTIPSQGAQTITPGTSNRTIASGRYLSGTQTIQGDSDLVASNIRSGVNIFGVTGTVAEGQLIELTSSMITWYTTSNKTYGITVRPGVNFSQVLAMLINCADEDGRWNFIVYPAIDTGLIRTRADLLKPGTNDITARNWSTVTTIPNTSFVCRASRSNSNDPSLTFNYGAIIIKS